MLEQAPTPTWGTLTTSLPALLQINEIRTWGEPRQGDGSVGNQEREHPFPC